MSMMDELAAAPGMEASPGAVTSPGATMSPGAEPDVLGVGFDTNPVLMSPSALTAQARVLMDRDRMSALPPLPTGVQLEILASQDLATSQAVAEFVYGLEADISDAQRRAVERSMTQLDEARREAFQTGIDPNRPELQAPTSASNRLREIMRDVGGGDLFNPPWTIASNPNAPVLQVKLEGIEKGLLPANTRLDGSWTPEVNNAFWELRNQKLNDWMTGERMGAASTSQVLEFVDTWLSPASLLSSAAATIAGDLLPNFNQIAEETKGWGGRIKGWLDDPLDPGKFVKALGPIDDIVFPMMNLALLWSGVATVTTFARVGLAAHRAGLSAAALRTSMPVAAGAIRGGAQAAALMGQAAQPGLMAQALGRGAALMGGAAPLAKGSQAMQAWRSYHTVQVARRAVGEGMKLGFAAQLEAEISPDRGIGLVPWGTIEGTAERRLEQWKAWRTSNPLVTTAATIFEPAFTPTSVLRPGSISRTLKSGLMVPESMPVIGGIKAPGWETITERLRQAPVLTHPTGAAYAGTDRLAEVGARLTLHADRTINRLVETGVIPAFADADEIINARTLRSFDNPVERIAYAITGNAAALRKAGTEEYAEVIQLANEKVLWNTLSKAIDHISEAQASGLVSREANPRRWHALYLASRKQIEARIRDVGELADFDPSNPAHLKTYALHALGQTDFDFRNQMSIEQVRGFQKRDIDAYTEIAQMHPTWFKRHAQEVIGHHQELRAATMNDLLDYLSPEMIESGLTEQWHSLAYNWDEWLEHIDEANFQHEVLGVDIDIRSIQALTDDPEGPWTMSPLGAEYSALLPQVDPSSIRKVPTDKTVRMLDSGNYAITVARKESATRQQADYLDLAISEMTSTRDRLAPLREIGGGRQFGQAIDSLKTYASELDKARVADLTPAEIAAWSQKVRGEYDTFRISGLTRKMTREAGEAIAWLDRQGYSISSGYDDLVKRLDELNNAPWWSRFKVDAHTFKSRVGPGSPQTKIGPASTTIDQKLANLRQVKEFIAYEVNIPLHEGAPYKVVVGDGFLQFQDMKNGLSPLADLKDRHVRRMSLGTFLSRSENAEVNGLRSVAFQQSLSGRLTQEFFDWDADARRWVPKEWVTKAGALPENFDPTLGSDDMRALERSLFSIHRQVKEVNLLSEATASGKMPRFFARAVNQSNAYNAYEMSPEVLDQWLGSEELGMARWGEKGLAALKGAMEDSKSIGWEYRGLAQMGDRIAREAWLKQASNVLKYSDAGSDLVNRSKLMRVMGVGAHSQEIDLYRHWKAMGMALAVGLYQGGGSLLAGEGPGQALGEGALGAAVGGAASLGASNLEGRGANVRLLTRFAAAEATQEATGSDLAGAVAGTVGFGGLRAGATRAHSLMTAKGWGQYSVVGEAMERYRNVLRFSLSPIFDIQRYTEGLVLSGATTYVDKDGVTRQAPLTLKPLKKAMKDLGVSKEEVLGQFENHLRGHEWAEALTLMDARMAERGIMGFSPFEAMAGTHAQLVAAGVRADDAVKHVQRIYQYGATARSGFEQSANFVFFPFSFQKQYLGRMGQFFGDDLGRLMVVHDGIKLWQQMNEHTGFHEWLKKKAPILDQLRKVNALAYGISPGQFGGINRPIIDALGSAGVPIDSALNLFLPNGVQINSMADADDFWRTVDRMVPALRDFKSLAEDMADMGYVATGKSHQSKEYDRQDGWRKWQELKNDFADTAQSMGVSYRALLTNPQYEAFRREFSRRQRELQELHPAWAESQIEATAKTAERAQDLTMIRNAPEDAAERLLGRFAMSVEQMQGIYGSELDLWPPSVQSSLRRQAASMAARDADFKRLYERFYMRDLGPFWMEV